jgi:hypothetical protein
MPANSKHQFLMIFLPHIIASLASEDAMVHWLWLPALFSGPLVPGSVEVLNLNASAFFLSNSGNLDILDKSNLSSKMVNNYI